MFLTTDGEFLFLKCPYETRDVAKSIPGYYWANKIKSWRYPLNRNSLKDISEKFPGVQINEHVDRVLAEKDKQVETARSAKHFVKDNIPSKIPLFSHQKITVQFLSKLHNAADFSDLGTGKTGSQITLINYRKKEEPGLKVLVVCPKSIIQTAWMQDIEKFSDLKAEALIGSTVKKLIALNKPADVYVTNYEGLRHIKDPLLKAEFDWVILDESSKIKNRTAQQTKICILLGEKAKYRNIMTGLPTPNTMLEIFSQFRFLDKAVFGTTFFGFASRYFYKGGFMNREWFPKTGSLKAIQEEMFKYGIRHRKSECTDLPKLVFQDLLVEVPDDQMQIYREMKKNLMAEIDGAEIEAGVALAKVQKLNQISNSFVIDTEREQVKLFKSQPKIDLLKEKVEEIIKQGDKLIIWSIYVNEIERVVDMLETMGLGVGVLYGDVKQKDKDEYIKTFQESDKLHVMVCHPMSASHGLTLTAANYAIWLSWDYSFERYEQANGRINRLGQKKSMTIYHIVAKNTIDFTILKCLSRKEKFSLELLNSY